MNKFINIAKAIALVFTFAFVTTSANANEILGKWKTESGETALITNCGSSICIVLKTGDYKGQSIGKLKVDGNKYKGSVRDPADDKTYTGSIVVTGNSLKMQGCIAIFCKTQKWTRM